MLRIGLTGGVGSGKSTASRFFAELDVPVIDADQLARELVTPDSPALSQIVNRFGTSVLNHGELDRARLRERIFQDPAARDALEAILHPAIRQEIGRRVSQLSAPYCIIAIPLLVERHWDSDVDRVLVIDATPERQIARTEARDGVSRAAVEGMLRAQASREERLARADDIIENNGELAHLREQVKMLHERYLARATTRKNHQ